MSARVAPAAAARLRAETKIRITLLGKIERLQKDIREHLQDQKNGADIDSALGHLMALVEDAPFVYATAAEPKDVTAE